MQYTQAQWLLFFYIYCFLGWIWETCYVSLLKREWVNRGFLHGPILPIYGFGAIIILWLTMPFKDNLLHIYVLGMIGATILEYVTGAAMERLFHMRYWDYSHHPFNLNGHISLLTSLGWGFFSVLLVEILHPPIEQLLLQVAYYTAELLSLILTVIFVADTTKSVQSALDMKELMTKLAENSEYFAMLEDKLNAASANISQGSQEFQEHIQRIEKDLQDNIAIYQQHKEAGQRSRKAFLLEKLLERKDKKSRLFTLLNEKADAAIQEIHIQMQSNISDSEQTRLYSLLTQLNEFKTGLKRVEINMAARKDKEYQVAANFIRRNPSSVSRRFKEAFEEIKLLNESRHERHNIKDTK
ncbi:putative ABC transporter permease [Sedimentibacter sp. MB31-C6]|uniref:putative ABC transporter permease n=1 Tax=Sedimentibacter sp. MB31-C6 TaxID=3109366 RepID=UPI002DDCB774|nr:hypothetical protein [Sedimentibacter sp. MB36-C1]WSI03178.1 hypothetical protein U8307_08995 [Sedimentibacter sp. MB36-C1]